MVRVVGVVSSCRITVVVPESVADGSYDTCPGASAVSEAESMGVGEGIGRFRGGE